MSKNKRSDNEKLQELIQGKPSYYVFPLTCIYDLVFDPPGNSD